MPETIYRLVILGPSESYQRLSREDQKSMFEERRSNLRELGGRAIVACRCFEQWDRFLIVEFPDEEALQKRRRFVEELGAKYKLTRPEMSLLGYKAGGDLETTDLPYFRLYAAKGWQGTYKPTEEDRKTLKYERFGGQRVIHCRPIAIPWRFFGIQQFPSLEAIAEYSNAIRNFQSEHGLYWEAINLHGVKVS